MTRIGTFFRNGSGAAAAEFALVLPVALLFFFGIIDVGRYVWTMSELEKAVQMGTRYAVATRVVAGMLKEADYTKLGMVCPNPNDPDELIQLTAGAAICKEAQGEVTCNKDEGTLKCSCVPTALGDLSCQGDETDVDATAFTDIVKRMRVTAPFIDEGDVTVRYSGSGLGYAGDPATDYAGDPLSDAAPIVTVEVKPKFGMRALTLMGMKMRLPSFSYSQTLEDGDGRRAY